MKKAILILTLITSFTFGQTNLNGNVFFKNNTTTSITGGVLMITNTATGLSAFQQFNITGSNITVSGFAPNFTLTGAATNNVVNSTLSGSGIVTVSGSNPYTISANAQTITGVNITVSGSYPSVTVTGNPLNTAVNTTLSGSGIVTVSGSNPYTISANAQTITGVNITVSGTYPSITLTGNIAGSGSTSTVGGLRYVFQSTAPSDTTVVWVDMGNENRKAYPIRHRITGSWQPVTEELDYWDYLTTTVSKGLPYNILFSGQSNVATALYYPANNSTYVGDTTQNRQIIYWNNSTLSFKIWKKFNEAYPFSSIQSLGINNIISFSKELVKNTKRTVRLIGTRETGIALQCWASVDSACYKKMKQYVTVAGVGKMDAFIWIHGEAGVGTYSGYTNYRKGFYDLVDRLRNETFIGFNTKFISTSHALGCDNPLNDQYSAEGTARGLEIDNDYYTGWAPIPSPREPKFNAVDGYHFTTIEHERMGQSIYRTFASLPYGKNEARAMANFTNYTLTTLGANTISGIIRSYVGNNSVRELYTATDGNSGGTFTGEYGFSANAVLTAKALVIAQGSNNRGNFEWWCNTSGTEATQSDRVIQFSYGGILAQKPLLGISSLGITSGASNSGNALLNFYHDGTTIAGNGTPKALIASVSKGSFGRSDMHFVFSPSSGATPVVGSNTIMMINADGRIGVLTTTPSSSFEINGSYASNITSITTITTLAVTNNTVIADGTSNAVDVMLPQSNQCIGREYLIYASSIANTVRIGCANVNDQILYGRASFNSTQYLTIPKTYQYYRVKSASGNRWHVISSVYLENDLKTSSVNNSGTGETVLYTTSLIGDFLIPSTGSNINARYSGTYNNNTGNKTLRVTFMGTEIFTSGAITPANTGSFDISVQIIRTGTTTARAVVSYIGNISTTTTLTTQTDLTGLTFSANNTLLLLGTSAFGSNDITAKTGKITFEQ